MNWKALASLASTIFNWAFGKVLVEIEKDLAEGAVTDSIPFAGWLVVAVNIATGVAQLAQTIVEVATSPWNIQHSLSTSITTNVVIKPDPRHNSFPRGDGKRTYKVKMIYKDEIRPTQRAAHTSSGDRSEARRVLQRLRTGYLVGVRAAAERQEAEERLGHHPGIGPHLDRQRQEQR